ncbi:hypothetical protein D3C78_1472890 [compost metagenome]
MVAAQADRGLAAEQAVALRAVAVIGREAAFQSEDRRQAVAQVFRAAQAKTRTVLDAVVHADPGVVVAAIHATVRIGGADLAALIGHAQVNDAVQGDGRFRLRRTGHASQNRANEQSFC